MTTWLIAPRRGPEGPGGWLTAEEATFHAGLVPVWLYAPTRRSLTGPLDEALMYAGRAQPTLAEALRRLQRSDIARLQVALGRSGQDLVILQAQYLHPLDLPLFATAATAAGVDLWLAPTVAPRDRLADAVASGGIQEVTEADARAAWHEKRGSNRRRRPAPCEAAVPIGSGTTAGPGCLEHVDAGGCVLAVFGDALAAARTHPLAVRHRLHELSRTLPSERAWAIYAAARDPFSFVERALHQLGVTAEENRQLSIGSLSPDGAHLNTKCRVLDVPKHLRAVLRSHRDIRVAEGSTPSRPFTIPTDDRTRTRTRVR